LKNLPINQTIFFAAARIKNARQKKTFKYLNLVVSTTMSNENIPNKQISEYLIRS